MIIGSLPWWSILLTVNLLDFVMVYIIAHAMLKRRVAFKWDHVGLAVVYTAIVGLSYYFLGGYFLRIISTSLLVFSIKYVSKYRNLKEALVIYAMSFLLIAIIQSFILVIISLFGWNQELTFFTIQIFTAGAIVGCCKKFKLNRLLYALQMNIVLKLILSIISLLILITLFFLNFNHHFLHYLYFSIVAVLIGIVLIPLLLTTYQKVIGLISVHDLHNSLLSMGIMIEDIDDPELIKAKFKTLSKEFGMDLNQLDFSGIENECDYGQQMEKKIEAFINAKTAKYGNDIDIDLELSYYKDCEQLDDPQIILGWLGTLLDNAFEAVLSQPIYIYLSSTKRTFTLRMANEYLGEEGKDLNRIFEKGYSTKDEGRGVGLHNLYMQVTKLGGDVEVDEYYTEAHNCQYIQISIKFKKEELLD